MFIIKYHTTISYKLRLKYVYEKKWVLDKQDKKYIHI